MTKAATAIAIVLSFRTNMALSTPWGMERTRGGTARAVADPTAAATVDSSSDGATAAGVPANQFAASIAGATSRPRRSSLDRNIRRPRESRLLTVPTGHRSERAASSCDLPSRWQSTMTSRNLPGSRSSSPCRMGLRSS